MPAVVEVTGQLTEDLGRPWPRLVAEVVEKDGDRLEPMTVGVDDWMAEAGSDVSSGTSHQLLGSGADTPLRGCRSNVAMIISAPCADWIVAGRDEMRGSTEATPSRRLG